MADSRFVNCPRPKVFFRGLNGRSVRRRTVSAKENYIEINKTGPPNQRPETLTN